MVVPDCAQRGVLAVPQAQTGDGSGQPGTGGCRRGNRGGWQLSFSDRTQPGGGGRFGPAFAGPARGGSAEDLPGLQVRRNGRDSGMSGFHGEVPVVYRARPPEGRPGSNTGTRCVMSCSPFDLRDYFLKELTDPQQHQVEAHVQDCSGCREELDRLRLTGAALCSWREEEIPQRIGFVSDPVFQRSWWAAFWGSSARLGFASAAVLSVAILVLGLTHRAPAVFS